MSRGFTILELSVVMVVVSLILGAVFAGQSLKRSSELNRVVSDIEKFKSAIAAFELQYDAIPGDMGNATSYWGAQHATPATCQTTASTTKLTCDGDSDGQISAGGSQQYERFRFWQHLANAGFIKGVFAGIGGAAGVSDVTPGYNSPETSISGGGFGIEHVDYSGTSNGDWFSFDYGHTITAGADALSWGPAGPLVTTKEAYNIDAKYDDGKPVTGKVINFKSTSTYAPGCTTTAVATTSEYDVSNSTSLLCSVHFRVGF